MKKILIIVLLLVLSFVFFMRLNYVWPAGFPDRTSEPLLPESALELVANLAMPPANIAINKQGRVFVTLHPEAKPTTKTNLGEIVDGQFVAWPMAGLTEDKRYLVKEAYGVRFDKQGLLWVLDNYPARLLAFNVETMQLVDEYQFPDEVFPFASHANDLQISANDDFIYISDDGLFNQRPGIVVYEINTRRSWRHLDRHKSVLAGDFSPVVQGVEMTMLGLFSINPGVDGIALSRDNQWLYYASFSADKLYKIRTEILNQITAKAEAAVVEVAEKTFTDGMTSDQDGNIYLSDIEHSAIMRLSKEGNLETLLQSNKLRWPDGFGFDANGYLYVTCSSLQQVVLKSQSSIKQTGPYQIYRIKVSEQSIAGH